MSGESYNLRTGSPRQLLRFEITEGPRKGEVVTVPMPEPGEPPILIGRSRDCAIWIDAQNISRRNTEILSGPDRWPLIRDMGSVNGTQVNGQPVSQTQPMPIRQGDHIRIGLTELIFSGLMASQPTPISGPLPPPPTVATAPIAQTLGMGGLSQLTPPAAVQTQAPDGASGYLTRRIL